MEFGLTSDQRMMQASLDGVLARLCPLDRVRAFAQSNEPAARDVWAGLVDLGLPGVLIAEEYGGLGLTLLDATLAAERLGAWVAPTPFLASGVLVPLAIAHAGSEAQKSRWLPRLAAGAALAGVAVGEAISGSRDGAEVTAREGRLFGATLFALDAAGADLLIVADAAGGLHLVEAGALGASVVGLNSIDLTRRLYELRLDGAVAEPLPGDCRSALAALRNAAWTLLAADMLGTSGAMLDKTVAYSKERRQFGRLIGSFQAVKHLCAEMAAELEPCRALVWYAAYAQSAVPDEAAMMAAHAKAHLSEVSRFVARTATEVHGGVGFTDLCGLHYWFKRVGLDRQLFGGPERLRTLAADLQGLRGPDG